MTFIKSIKREVGRNTGKVISNMFFGDRHSTPHRFITSRNKSKKNRELSQKDRAKLLEIDRINLENKLKTNFVKTEHELDLERKKFQRINILEGEIAEEIKFLSEVNSPSKESDLIEFIDSLDFKLSAGSWKNVIGDDSEKKENILQNKLMEAYFTKYKVSLRKLNRLNSSLFPIYDSIFKKHKWKRIFGKYKIGFVAILALLGMSIGFAFLYLTGKLN
jgi:hypothetical protein